MQEEYSEEDRLNEFLMVSRFMIETMRWLEEYEAFGDGLDSELEYQNHQLQ